MVRCEKCDTPNSLDSRFCKTCGAELTDVARIEGAEKLQELVGEGYRLLGADRAEEALLVAESALGTDANNVQALALKGASLERLDRLVEALEAFERVVELSPDSQIDRVKVNFLRNELAKKARPEPMPNKRLAIGVAVCVAVLVMAAGAIVSVMANKQEAPEPARNLVATNSNDAAGFNLQAGTGANPPQANGSQTTTDPAPVATQPSEAAPQRPLPDLGSGTLLPRPLPSGEIGGVAPLTPPGLDLKPENPPARETSNDPPPKLEPEEPAVKPDPGQYEIKVYTNANRPLGGGESVSTGNQLTALLRTARDQFQLGQYASAAKTYEAAINAGGDAGSLYQRVGQCHSNAGHKAEAITAYNRAIAAYEAQIKQGTASDSAKRGLETSRQALKILQSR